MKNKIKLSLLLLAALFSVNVVLAKSLPDTAGLPIVTNFANCFMHPNADILRTILDDEAVMKMPRFNTVIIQTKDQLTQEAQANAGTSQNCASEISVLSSSNAILVAEVTFRYSDFQESVYVTVERSGEQWKITQMVKMFSDRPAATNRASDITAQ